MHTRFFKLMSSLVLMGLILLPLRNAISNRFTVAKAAAEFQLADYSANPLHITNVSILPEPTVNHTATLHIEVLSTEDQPAVWFTVNFLDMYANKVHWVAGDVAWRGALIAYQPQSFDIDIIVSEAGSWPILISIDRTAPGSKYYTLETIQIESSEEAGQLIRSIEYNDNAPKSHSFVLPAQGSALQSSCKTQSPPPPTAGQIQIVGNIAYDALKKHSGEPITIVHAMLGRITMRLWDKSNLLIPLDVTCTDVRGYYEFAPVANSHTRELMIEILSTDGVRVYVTNSLNDLYYETKDVGIKPDGIQLVDYTIPADASEISQAFYIFDLTANVAYGWLEQQNIGWSNQDFLHIRWPVNCIEPFWGDACYRGEIELGRDRGKEPDTIIHEYGHFVLAKAINDDKKIIFACIPFAHEMWKEHSATCAWSEGWADFFQAAVQGHTEASGFSLDPVPQADLDKVIGNPVNYQGIVAASLLNIFDSTNQAYDELSDGFNGPAGNGIWHYSTVAQGSTGIPFNITDFWNEWKADRPAGACFGSAILQQHLLDYEPFMYGLEARTNPFLSGLGVTTAPLPGCPNRTYEKDTFVSLQAVSSLPAYTFGYWRGDLAGSANPATIKMDAAKQVTAHFVTRTPTPAVTHTATRTPTRTASPTITATGPTPTPTDSASPPTPTATIDATHIARMVWQSNANQVIPPGVRFSGDQTRHADMKWNGFQNGILHARYTFQFHYWVGPGIGRLALRVWTGDYFGLVSNYSVTCDSGKWMDRGDGLNDFLYFADDESFDINDRCVVDFDIILRDDSNATLALAVMHFNHSYAATYGAAYEGYWEVLGVEIPLPTPTPTPTPQPTDCPPGEICPAGGVNNP